MVIDSYNSSLLLPDTMPFTRGGKNPSLGRVNRRKTKQYLLKVLNERYTSAQKCAAIQNVKDGMHFMQAAKAAGIRSERTVEKWFYEDEDMEEKRKGRRRIIPQDSELEKQLHEMVEQQPFSSNADIWKQISQVAGKSVSIRTLQRQLNQRALPPFTRKVPDKSTCEVNLDMLYDMHEGYIDGLRRELDSGAVTIDQLFYLDEFPILQGKLPRTGRCRKGKKIYAREPYRCTRYTGIAVVGIKGAIKVELYKQSMNDSTFLSFCLESQDVDDSTPNIGGAPLTDSLPTCSYLIMDRLGRSGRSANPQRIHYNPVVHSELRKCGVQVVILPPKGHCLNPEELFHGILQRKIAFWSRQYRSLTNMEGRRFHQPLSKNVAKLYPTPWKQ